MAIWKLAQNHILIKQFRMNNTTRIFFFVFVQIFPPKRSFFFFYFITPIYSVCFSRFFSIYFFFCFFSALFLFSFCNKCLLGLTFRLLESHDIEWPYCAYFECLPFFCCFELWFMLFLH